MINRLCRPDEYEENSLNKYWNRDKFILLHINIFNVYGNRLQYFEEQYLLKKYNEQND